MAIDRAACPKGRYVPKTTRTSATAKVVVRMDKRVRRFSGSLRAQRKLARKAAPHSGRKIGQ